MNENKLNNLELNNMYYFCKRLRLIKIITIGKNKQINFRILNDQNLINTRKYINKINFINVMEQK